MKQNFKYEYERETQYKYNKQEVIQYILDKKYGDTLYNQDLAKMFGFNLEDAKENDRFHMQMGKIKNILIDYGYVLKTIIGVGYYILKPKQISGYCYHTYIRKTENLLGKSAKILVHTEISELSEIRKEEYNNICDLNIDTSNAIATTIENSSYYKNKNYYDSLND